MHTRHPEGLCLGVNAELEKRRTVHALELHLKRRVKRETWKGGWNSDPVFFLHGLPFCGVELGKERLSGLKSPKIKNGGKSRTDVPVQRTFRSHLL